VNYLNVRLSNSSTSNVKEMFYDKNYVAPELPRVVFADFGVQHAGESFFPNKPLRRGWFPIYLVENKCYTPDKKSNDRFAEHLNNVTIKTLLGLDWMEGLENDNS